MININDDKRYIKYDLQLFAEGPGGEKTEKATPKKREKVRSEGQVAKSTEIINTAMLLSLFLLIRYLTPYWYNNFANAFSYSFKKIADVEFTQVSVRTATSFINWGIWEVFKNVWPVFLTTVSVAIIANLAQVKWKVSGKMLKPKFSRLNPASGVKKMFSPHTLAELFKSLAKVGVVVWVAYDTISGDESLLVSLYEFDLIKAVGLIGNMIIDFGIRISFLFLLISLADIKFVRSKFEKDIRMTKQEIKDEWKNSEGNPEIKGKIKRKQREMSMRRMMQDLPTADVIITNPTHFAVAVKYDMNEHPAPYIVAKGADLVAAKIKEKAREFKIEIIENKPLARMIYFNVDIGEQIPQEMYQAVAEVLAFVYSLKNKKK